MSIDMAPAALRAYAENALGDCYWPAFSIATYNANGLSLQTNRGRCMIANIKTLVARNDIVAIQETHLEANDYALKKYFPEHTILYSNRTAKIWGVITIISPKISANYDIEQIDLPEDLAGRLIVASLTQRADAHRRSLPSIKIFNFYLDAGRDLLRTRQIRKAKLSTSPADYNMAAGDFNFVMRDEDS